MRILFGYISSSDYYIWYMKIKIQAPWRHMFKRDWTTSSDFIQYVTLNGAWNLMWNSAWNSMRVTIQVLVWSWIWGKAVMFNVTNLFRIFLVLDLWCGMRRSRMCFWAIRRKVRICCEGRWCLGRSQDFYLGGVNLKIWKYPMYN